jgi:hypothetical protein
MSFFDNIKDVANQAQEKLEQAQGLLKGVEGFLPDEQRQKVDALLGEADGALSQVTGKKGVEATTSETDKEDTNASEGNDSSEL